MKKFFVAVCAVLLSVCVVLACGSCGKPDPAVPQEKEILVGYDISGISVKADGKSDITYGTSVFKAMEYTEGEYSMKYRVCFPEDYGKTDKDYPVLMFFHGAGERGDNNEKQITTYTGFAHMFTSDADSPLLDAIVIAPQCPAGEKWVNVPAWTDCEYSTEAIAESDSLEAALKLLKYYAENERINENAIYSMGLSMGGYATWDIAVRHSELLAAIAPICGGCDTSKSALLKDMPVYTFHGSADGTVPPTGTRNMVNALREAGNENVKYVEYEGQGHGIWNTAMESDVITWMFSNVKTN